MKQSILLLQLFFLLAANPMQLHGQGQTRPPGLPVNIHGEVRFAGNEQRAENVLVVLESFAGGLIAQTRTDRAGKFQFAGISQANYKVTASIAGFRSVSQDVDLMTTMSEYVILTLVPDKIDLKITPDHPGESVLDSRVPEEARNEYEKGRSKLMDRADSIEGILHLERSVKLYPDYLEAQLLLGTAYMDIHKMDKAESALKRALDINPKTPQALFALGEIYREAKKYPEAEKSLLQGLQLENSSWQGHLALGRLYWETGNTPKAGVEVGRTLQLKPDAADAYLLAGNVLLKTGKAQEALQMFSEYLKVAPKGPYAEQTQKIVEKIKNAIAEKK